MDPGRRLVYRFFSLSYHRRMSLVRALGLTESGDGALAETECFRRCFRRAEEGGLLSTLWSQVEALHPDGDPTRNPFVAD
jgi:hypothetical protein